MSANTARSHRVADGAFRFRTIWISDLHLGTARCQAGPLLEFLRHTRSDQLYLVGNIVDGSQLRRRWHWPQQHNDVVQKVLRKARKGTKVVFIPGRHDDFGRNFERISFGGIEIRSEAVHTTADGRRLLVLSGDLFDTAAQRARLLAAMEGRMNNLTRRLNGWWLQSLYGVAGLAGGYGARYRDLKARIVAAKLVDFERGVAAEARRRGVDGVVCGHTRKATIRDVDGILYCNDGDWVESLTALVEDDRGQLRVIKWRDLAPQAIVPMGWAPATDREATFAHSHS